MEDSYQELRNCIYTNTTELIRFRQLIINCVMATDIIDTNLNKLRKERWIKAFESNNDKTSSTETIEDINRKATIVIEHLIQVRAKIIRTVYCCVAAAAATAAVEQPWMPKPLRLRSLYD